MILLRRASILLSCLALPIMLSLAGCSALKSISILPASGSVVLTGVGQTAQFTAFGSSQMGSGQPTTSNLTTSVTWAVSNPSVASINASGLATAVGSGYTQITAVSGGTVATSDLTVAISSSSTGTSTPSITVTPNTATETFTGETTQFIATGNLTGSGSAQNLTNQVQWSSSNVQVATISSGGLATAVGGGTTTIVAQSGGINATATLTVATNVAASTPTLTLIPNGATATFTGETTQFIALGNLSGGIATQNLTGSVAWSSSDVSVATIDQAGLATAVAANQGSAVSTTITAIGTISTGSLIAATTTLTVSPAGGTITLPSLAIYEAGTGTGTVVSSPGTILCGSSAAGASCTGSFQLNITVMLTATPGSGSVFGGWSANCTPVAGNPLQCSIKMSNNETVGAIFNP